MQALNVLPAKPGCYMVLSVNNRPNSKYAKTSPSFWGAVFLEGSVSFLLVIAF